MREGVTHKISYLDAAFFGGICSLAIGLAAYVSIDCIVSLLMSIIAAACLFSGWALANKVHSFISQTLVLLGGLCIASISFHYDDLNSIITIVPILTLTASYLVFEGIFRVIGSLGSAGVLLGKFLMLQYGIYEPMNPEVHPIITFTVIFTAIFFLLSISKPKTSMQQVLSEEGESETAQPKPPIPQINTSSLTHSLNTLWGALQIIETSIEQPKLVKYYAGIGMSAFNQASTYIESLIPLSYFTPDHLSLNVSKIDVPTVVSDAVASKQKLAHAHRIQLNLHQSHSVSHPFRIFDKAKLTEMVHYLIDQALNCPTGDCTEIDFTVNYSSTNSTINITVLARGNLSQKAVIDEVLAKTYSSVYAESAKKSSERLRLEQIARLVHSVGGDISGVAEPSIGTTLSVSIPMMYAETHAIQSTQNNVLLIDNLVGDQLMFNTLASGFDLNIYSVESTHESKGMNFSRFRSVFLGCHLPLSSSIQNLEWLKEYGLSSNVIACIEADDPTSEDAYLKLGFTGVLRKPYRHEALEPFLKPLQETER